MCQAWVQSVTRIKAELDATFPLQAMHTAVLDQTAEVPMHPHLDLRAVEQKGPKRRAQHVLTNVLHIQQKQNVMAAIDTIEDPTVRQQEQARFKSQTSKHSIATTYATVPLREHNKGFDGNLFILATLRTLGAEKYTPTCAACKKAGMAGGTKHARTCKGVGMAGQDTVIHNKMNREFINCTTLCTGQQPTPETCAMFVDAEELNLRMDHVNNADAFPQTSLVRPAYSKQTACDFTFFNEQCPYNMQQAAVDPLVCCTELEAGKESHIIRDTP